MRISYIGSRSGITDFQYDQLAAKLITKGCTEFIFSGDIFDDKAFEAARFISGVKIFTVYPAVNRISIFPVTTLDIEQYFESAIFNVTAKIMKTMNISQRNQAIIDASEFTIFCPKEFKHTIASSTWSAIRYAWKRKKEHVIIPPIER